MSYKRPVLVFDIDGTLVEASGVGRQALDATYQCLGGSSGAFDHLDFRGATDHHLFALATATAPLPVPERLFWAHYPLHLRHALDVSPLSTLPGVAHLLSCLSASLWPMALGTGNIRAGAFLKLSSAGIAPYFKSGGFSLPGFSRQDVIGQAVAPFKGRPGVVIGDTPRDIEAAHQRHLPAIGVATGRFSRQALDAAHADATLANLLHIDQFFDVLHNIMKAQGTSLSH